MRLRKLSIGIAWIILVSIVAIAANKPETFTGEVSDSMCGAKHMMEGGKAECTRACVGKGSSYALVVGDKVYALHTVDKAALAQLDKLAGEHAKITGIADGETIEVSGIAALK